MVCKIHLLYNENMNTVNKAKIKEIFQSIQGEGLYIGCSQIFVRFCACNLYCDYCDTDFYPTNINNKDTFFEFTPNELCHYLKSHYNLSYVHSVSLTGGEPLIWADFLKEFLPKLDLKYYLETNATIDDNAKVILPLIDIVAGDVKLPSCSGLDNSFEMHSKFYEVVSKSRNKSGKSFNRLNNNFFSKVVFDENIKDSEIKQTLNLAKKYYFQIIIQPRMIGDKPAVSTDFMMDVYNKFIKEDRDVRLIPQVHKFINVE